MIIRAAQPIATTTKSSTDRRAVFVSVNNESGIVDLLIPQRTERFGQLRCIYIDTSAQDSSGNGCMIETDLGQNVQAPAGTQGYYPVFIPFVSKLTVSSNESVNLLLLDFDVQPSQWHVANASSVVPNPLHVIVDDQPLTTNATIQNWPASQHVTLDGQPINVDSTVQNFPESFGAVQSGAWNVGVNNFPASQAVTIQNQPITSNAATTGTFALLQSGTAVQFLIASAAILRFLVIESVQVVSGAQTLSFADAGTDIYHIAVPATSTAYSSVVTLYPLAKNISTNLNVRLGATLTSGVMRIFAGWT